VEVGNLSLVRRFVSAGLGVAPVPSIAFGDADRMPRVRRLALRGAGELLYESAVRAGAPPARDAQRLLELVRMGRASA
jgi:DNA-binding transcriptional LysR family regulator